MFISLLLPKFRAHLLLLLSSITELVALAEDKNEKITPEFCRISADFGRFWPILKVFGRDVAKISLKSVEIR
jgi:hypothetical protein